MSNKKARPEVFGDNCYSDKSNFKEPAGGKEI